MILETSEFVFNPPAVISRARRVLIKPCASYPVPYPVTTSAALLGNIISSIRQVSDADILLLEGTSSGAPIYPIYQALGYNFPRVLTMDVKDCILVEVDNPLVKPFAMPTFWMPNVILSSDYLITVSPLKVHNNTADLSVANLLSVLPISKYHGESPVGWGALYALGIEKVLADLYFTLPMDMAIIDGTEKFTVRQSPIEGESTPFGKMFVGEPYTVDGEVSERLGLHPEYLSLIKSAKVEMET